MEMLKLFANNGTTMAVEYIIRSLSKGINAGEYTVQCNKLRLQLDRGLMSDLLLEF